MGHAHSLLPSFLCSLPSPIAMMRICLHMCATSLLTFTCRVSSDPPSMGQGRNSYPHFFREMDQFPHVHIVVKLTVEPDFLMPGLNLPWVLCSCQPLKRGAWTQQE